MPFLLSAGFLCSMALMENKTAFPWNDYDLEMKKQAMRRCAELHAPRSPCVKRFIKFGERDYNFVCGAPLKSQ